ncbi:alpha-hydroxy acid oxidase [Streptomyces sp. SL13]|jgi:isopentenyl diphosphate isomerase/L-lactate dehydrogenase-like FMN-dependent dehydrogenase|uniref:Alpha-hydroxy acid oxidase n=1 Tax=Streptantibioticus silvisoli TaxID=2705255 RepID=A0AA90H4F2_9ACTN|nr:alpha-hydroxy acid oxidase [Streptantibioticus silvisoli]MDI5971781.1 alpha-hydroxy acid oxidase [Streptantibioticus silvisoli]
MTHSTDEQTVEPTGERFATLEEIYARARERLDADTWAVLDGGAGVEQSLRDNLAALSRWSFRPKYLSGVTELVTGTTFLGIDLAFPVLTAPIGGDGMFHERGQCEIAAATAMAGIAPVVSEASRFSLETVAAAGDGPKIMQLHAWGEPEEFLALAHRACQAGYSALCVTIDCPTLGWRERTMTRRFVTPQEQWSGNYGADATSAANRLVSGSGSDWTWETLSQVRQRLDVPMLVKGVLTGEDAELAVAAGVDGIVVSNHGGRQLDCLPGTVDQLPEVVETVRGRVPVAVDGGIRRGADVLKALALGADVVLVGRLTAMALAAGGAAGVYAALSLLRAEFERSMLLAGRRALKDLDRSVVQPRAGGPR